MRIYIYVVCTIFIFGCENKQKKSSKFNEEQINSLSLESTKILKAETDSVTKVDLNPFLEEQSFNFGSLIKEIKLIPLETNDASLLDDIRNIIVTESNIYIHDDFMDGGIVIFDSKGKFVKRISHGRGPGEINRLYDIDFDKSKNELIAYKNSFLMFFTPSGEFIRQQRLPFIIHEFAVFPEGYVFKTLDRPGNYHLGALKDYTLLVTNNEFKLKSVGLPSHQTGVNLEGHEYLHNNRNLYISQKFADTIYQYTDDTSQLKAKYFLDYSKKKLPGHYAQNSWDKFENVITKNDYYFYLGQYLDSGNHNIFLLENWHKGIITIVYRDKESGNLIGGTRVKYDINEMPPISIPRAVSNDYFISLYLPHNNELFTTNSTLFSEEDKLKSNDLTENDNPVLVFYKLKSF